jgi:hypothetical protein
VYPDVAKLLLLATRRLRAAGEGADLLSAAESQSVEDMSTDDIGDW